MPAATRQGPLLKGDQSMPADDAAALVLSLIPRRMRGTVAALRTVVREALPSINEKPQPRTKTFNFDSNGALLAISGYQNWASVGFVRGDQLVDHHHLLEGSGRGMRHLQVRSGSEVPVEALSDLVRQAAALNERLGPPKGFGPGWGRQV